MSISELCRRGAEKSPAKDNGTKKFSDVGVRAAKKGTKNGDHHRDGITDKIQGREKSEPAPLTSSGFKIDAKEVEADQLETDEINYEVSKIISNSDVKSRQLPFSGQHRAKLIESWQCGVTSPFYKLPLLVGRKRELLAMVERINDLIA